jgi:hypothetical protein
MKKNYNQTRNISLLIFTFIIIYLSFITYEKYQIKKNIDNFISQIDQNELAIKISYNNSNSLLLKNFFKKEFEIHDFEIIADDQENQESSENEKNNQSKNIPILGINEFSLKKTLFKKIIIKKTLSNVFSISSPDLIETSVIRDNKNKNIEKFFFNLSFKIDMKFNNKIKDLNIKTLFANLDFLKYFQYQDSKITIFDKDLKNIYESQISNKIEIINNNPSYKYIVDIKDNKLVPGRLKFDIEFIGNKDLNKEILLINNFSIKILDFIFSMSGKIQDYITNIDTKLQNNNIFPNGDIKFSIKDYDYIINLSELLLNELLKNNRSEVKKYIADIRDFIKNVGRKEGDFINFYYQKNDGERFAKINEKIFSEDHLLQ